MTSPPDTDHPTASTNPAAALADQHTAAGRNAALSASTRLRQLTQISASAADDGCYQAAAVAVGECCEVLAAVACLVEDLVQFDVESEAEEYTDTGELWTIWDRFTTATLHAAGHNRPDGQPALPFSPSPTVPN